MGSAGSIAVAAAILTIGTGAAAVDLKVVEVSFGYGNPPYHGVEARGPAH